MKRARLLLTICLWLALSAPAAQATCAAKDSAWLSVRSPNYLFVGDAAAADMQQIARRFEQFRTVFAAQFPAAGLHATVPTVVFVFRDEESYRPFRPVYQNRPVDFAGYFQSGLDVNYVALPVDGRARDAYAKIFHESVHLLIDSRARRMPDWLNEGLALYYSTFEFSDADGKAVIGRPIAEYLRTLRTRNLLPLATLFAIERDSADYNEADKSGIFYAESWALVHYLISGHGGRRQLQILRFLELCAAGVPVEEGFRKGFGVDYAGMERELAAYLAQEITGVKYTDAARPVALDADWQTAPLTEAEAEYYQGDLLLHIDRLEDATRHLRRALELDERLAPAHAAFGVAAARQRMFRDAVSHLRRAVALQPDSYLAHYYYAYGLSRQGMDEAQAVNAYTPEAATVMRAELNRAIELAPAFPESYRLLAFVNLVTGEQLDEATALLRRALVLAPNRPDISYILAEVYVRKGDWAEARDALRRVFRSGAPARLRARANTLLARIDAEERAPVKH